MEHVKIGDNYIKQVSWKVYIGVPLIYVPIIISIPFVVLGVFMVKAHLRLMGAKNIQSYWDFVPHWISHRYRYDNQITYSTGAKWYNLRGRRWYWIFNCKLYCPLSVALFRYTAYLVIIVENWWCPFNHDKKKDYVEGAIDKSYWHLYKQDMENLHPGDCENYIWNEKGKKDQA